MNMRPLTGEVAVLVTNHALAREVHTALRALSPVVVPLSSVREAFDFLRHRTPTLLLIDEALDGVSHRGFFVLEALMRKEMVSQLTATVMLGHAVFRSQIWAAHDLAVDSMLIKPITHRAIQTHASKAMARRKALQPILAHLAAEDVPGALQAIDAQLRQDPLYQVALHEHKAHLLLQTDPVEAERFFRLAAADTHGPAWRAAGLIQALMAQDRLPEANALADAQLAQHAEHLPLLDAATEARLALKHHQKARSLLASACEHAALSLTRQRKAIELALALDDGREALTMATKVMTQFHDSSLLHINDRLRQFRAAAQAPASHTLLTGIEHLKQQRLSERQLAADEIEIWECLTRETRAREATAPLGMRQPHVRQALAALNPSEMRRQTAIACLEAAARTGLGHAGEQLRQRLLAEPLTEFDQLRLALLAPQLQQDDWGLASVLPRPADTPGLWARLRAQLVGHAN